MSSGAEQGGFFAQQNEVRREALRDGRSLTQKRERRPFHKGGSSLSFVYARFSAAFIAS